MYNMLSYSGNFLPCLSDWTNLHVQQKTHCVKYWSTEQKISEAQSWLKDSLIQTLRSEPQSWLKWFTISNPEQARSESNYDPNDSLNKTLICWMSKKWISIMTKMIHWEKTMICWNTYFLSKPKMFNNWIAELKRNNSQSCTNRFTESNMNISWISQEWIKVMAKTQISRLSTEIDSLRSF